MHFTNQEIFLFVALVPLLIVVGRKLRGKNAATPKAEHEAQQAGYPPELKRKIRIGRYADGETVLLAAFDSDVEANIVKGLLIDNGIYVEIRDEIIGATRFNYSYAVGGVKLFVHRSEIAVAQQLLTEHTQISSFEAKEWQPRLCPQCNSDMLTYQKYHPASALLLFLGAPFLPVRARRWVCLKCGHKWKE